jgi:hypothetical protein
VAATRPWNGPNGGRFSRAPRAASLVCGLTARRASSFVADGFLGLAGLVSKGSARVLATTSSKASQGVLCSAILAEAGSDPSVSMTSLPVIRKTAQQGD